MSFFCLLSALANRLKSIFSLTMAAHWSSSASCIDDFVAISEQKTSGSSDKKGVTKKMKKRDVDAMHDGNNHSESTILEMRTRASNAINAIHTVCTHAETGFVDEVCR